MALGTSTVSDFAGSVSDLFAGFGASTQADLKAKGLDIQAAGDVAEGENYDLAADLAAKNAQYSESSTAIKEMQIDRQNTLAIGGQAADVASAGFSGSGSAMDLMRDSASQGALTKAVAGQNGLIQTAGYQEQEQSYQTMSAAAKSTAAGLENLATETEAAGKTSEIGDLISAGIKGIAGVASIALAPVTAGASLALGMAATSAIGDPSGSGGLY
jgi:hypothetical protein